MARRTMDRRALRDMAEAADKLGAEGPGASGKSASSRRQPRSSGSGRMKVVWAVYDAGAHLVETFDFADKAKAEKLAEKLTAQKGSTHFVRKEKQAIG